VHNVFYAQTKIPLQKSPFWGTVHRICMLCMFRCADAILL